MSDPLSSLTASRCLIAALVLYALSNLWKAYKRHRELAHIPCIGPSGFFSSYIGALRFLTHGHEMFAEGYEKYPGRVFRVPTFAKWIIVVSGHKLIEDVKKAKDSQLSIHETGADVLQLHYTLGDELWMNPYHVDIIRGPVTRYIGARFPDISDEMMCAISELMPLKPEWQKLPIHDSTLQIVARTVARYFVGFPLCRNSDYIDLSIRVTNDAFLTGFYIAACPKLLRPIVGRLLPTIPRLIGRAMKQLEPVIQHRLEMEEKYGPDWPGKPQDFISWLLDVNGQDRSLRNLTCRLHGTNIAAIHTTSATLTWTLFALATHPKVAPSLREEVESVTQREGWTKAALVQMRKLDSFVKESSRIYSNGGAMTRLLYEDFTFSDGTVVPKGYFLNTVTRAAYYDEDNYSSADQFQEFRFSDMRLQEGESIKHQMVTPETDHLMFGIGRHACPGRFFAINEVKLATAYILLNYDVKLEDGREPPSPKWFSSMILPDKEMQLMFRSRK